MENSPPIRKFYVETYGCQMNVADSEEMSGEFLRRGFAPTADKEDADVILLNTCTVRQHAEQRALSYIGRLKEWKKQRKGRKIVVAGCAAERLKKELRQRFPHVDLVAGAKSMEQLPEVFGEFFKKNPPESFNWFKESEKAFGGGELRTEGEPFVLGDSETAFVTIMRGCNYSCSYCIVPAVRGREIYRDPETILSEIERKARAGSKKLMLLGQTVNSYWHRGAKEGAEGGEPALVDFAELLRRASQFDGIEEIKFMSPHPHYMNDRQIAAIAESKKVSSEIHLPVQSGSNPILKAMKRNYTREEYVEIARKLRAALPELYLSTDFIVGFPGETEEDFEQTLSLVEQVRFSMAYCFKYSPRAGTESAQNMADDVPESVKEARLARLLEKMESLRRVPASA